MNQLSRSLLNRRLIGIVDPCCPRPYESGDPGDRGLGGTEATIIWLLESLDIPREAAGSAALLVRLFTLWLAVVVGGLVFLVNRHLFLGPDSRGPASDEAGPADGRNGAPGTGG